MNVVNENEPLSTASAMHHLQKLNGLKNLGHPPRDMLWKVTFQHNFPYMEFIGPLLIDQYGCEDDGYRYYEQARKYVKASRTTYIHRTVYQLCLCWVSELIESAQFAAIMLGAPLKLSLKCTMKQFVK